VLVSDQVRGASEIVVDELREEHEPGPYQRMRLYLLK
jgi:hypothetical protein